MDGASLALSGGEPLVRRDLPEILDYADGKAHVILTTNGMLINEAVATRLAAMDSTIEISIDGSRADIHDRIRGQGAFEKTLQGMRHLAEAGIADRITFITTITQANVDDLESIIELAERVGAGFVRFSPVQPVERAETLLGRGRPHVRAAAQGLSLSLLGAGPAQGPDQRRLSRLRARLRRR